MAFTALSSADIAVGKPTKAELFDLIRTNFNNPFPIRFEMLGKYNTSDITTPATGLLYHRVNYDLTLTGAVIMIYTDGTSGTTEVDLQLKSGGGAFASVFSTKPSVAAGSGDFTTSSNAVFSTTDVDAGDILRMDLTSQPVGADVDGFELIVSYTVG
jgi:hypothetical protein